MSTPVVHAIIKLGAKLHLERLRTLGEVYLNTWGYFKGLEANDVQGDGDEGLHSIHQVSRGVELQVQINGRFEPISGLFGQIRIEIGDLEQHNLFCMFAVTDDSFHYLDDPRLLKFGDTAVIIAKGDDFLSRLRKKLKAEGVSNSSHLVQYVPRESHEGEMGPFRKLAPYAYQSEFRLLAHAQRGGPLKVEIGDISDISYICPLTELKSRLRLVTE